MTGTSPFLSLFRRSPFKPMQEHIRVVRRCAGEVPSLIEAMVAGDRDAVEAAKDKIFILEKAADEIKNQLRSHLPASLLMPVDRRDLLEILHLQDAIADTAQDIAGLLVIRPLDVPPDLAAPLRVFTARCAPLRPAASTPAMSRRGSSRNSTNWSRPGFRGANPTRCPRWSPRSSGSRPKPMTWPWRWRANCSPMRAT